MTKTVHTDKNAALRALPQVEELLQRPAVAALAHIVQRDIVADACRAAVDEQRKAILADTADAPDADAIEERACELAIGYLRPSMRRVINATGVIIHTNLGRSVLADEAIAAVNEVIRGYSTLEYDTSAMARGSRHDHVEDLLCALTGAEAAIAVNNNAAAVMMVLNEFAVGHDVLVSRGELVEIGGSFRVPDIMALSNAHMVEVGTTNKTHARDYERALTPDAAMLLKVHPSNFRLVGFTESVSVAELRALADVQNPSRAAAGQPRLLVYEDQGSGAFLRLDAFGTYAEPTVRESLAAGADLVSFSGDKLLGGPQAGIIVGSREHIERLKANPLARALRLDKMTLAALEATLRIYLDPQDALNRIPTLRMLTEDAAVVEARAERLATELETVVTTGCARLAVVPEIARAGGGSLPMCDIDTYAVELAFAEDTVVNAQDCERFLVQESEPPVVARIKKERLLFDARTIAEEDFGDIARALGAYFAQAL